MSRGKMIEHAVCGKDFYRFSDGLPALKAANIFIKILKIMLESPS